MNYRGIELVEHSNGKYYFENPELAKTYSGPSPVSSRRQTWMEKTRAVQTEACCCLAKVAHSRQHICWSPRGNSIPSCRLFCEEQPYWFDHAELFWFPATKEYILTAQPYNVTLEKVKAMEKAAERLGLVLEVSITDAWWVPGATPLLTWRRQGRG